MRRIVLPLLLCAASAFVLAGCGKAHAQPAASADTGAPPTPVVQQEFDVNHFKVDHPDHFPLTTAGEYTATPDLNVTGVVNPDVSRQVQVPSLVSGKVVEIDTRLGDNVTKGQLLFKMRSTDVAGAYSDYRQAVKNELLTKLQLDRSIKLFDDGAYPKSQLEIAQNAEDDNIVVLDTTLEHLRLLGLDPDHPTGIVSVFAPVAGTITDQEITIDAGIQALNPPNPFTISDMSKIWVICDVYENNLDQVHLNEYADIRLNAFPDKVLKGRISNILPVMDPNIRTGKVRLEVDNPGFMRLGMFATATFHGLQTEKHATVPATAIVHLHDREWVYSPAETGWFRRFEVRSGGMLPNGMQEVVSGVQPGQQVVTNALILQDTSEK
jgi:membrane fusion protein, heavy metal efflux system